MTLFSDFVFASFSVAGYFVVMKFVQAIKQLIFRRRFTLGSQVFQSKSWLEKQVQEAQFQQSRKIILGID